MKDRKKDKSKKKKKKLNVLAGAVFYIRDFTQITLINFYINSIIRGFSFFLFFTLFYL